MIHNNAKAGAKEKAIKRGIPTEWVPRSRFPDEAAYADRLRELLDSYEVEIVALAGFMQLIPASIVRGFRNRMTNIHPALLPLFGGKGYYGMNVHRAVFASGMKVSGATVHLVDEEYDHGPILLQAAVDIGDCRSPEEIARRVLKEEHRIYPKALGLLAEGRFRIEGNRTYLIDPGG